MELIMADDDAQREAEERRRYLRGIYGDDIFKGLATDQEPTGGSTIARHVMQDRRRQALDRRREADQDVNRRAAQVEAKKAAYERIQSGQSSTDQDRHLAAQYALEQGIVRPKSTRQRLIEQGQAGRRPGRS
jgi:hypothetical protein